MEAGLLLQILASFFAAAAVYGGIRADIKNLHEQISEAKSAANRAHERIDIANQMCMTCKKG